MLRKIRTFFNNLKQKNKNLNFLDVENLVCYICGNDALPLPLEADEERILLEELSNGNDSAKEKLIEHNLRLVVYIAKKFENTGLDLEDLISIGAIGLIKAVQTYKYDKQIKLATYASRCISNEILMHIRKNKKSKNDVSLDDTLNYDAEGNELKLSDVVGTEEDIVDRQFQDKMNREFLANEINNLSKRDKEIMMLRYGLNNTKEYTQKEVANMLGISQSYISRIEKKVINEISKVIN